MSTQKPIEKLLNLIQVFRKPESVGFAVLISLATWVSVIFPRVMGIVLPVAAIVALAGIFRARRRLRLPPMENEIWLVWAVTVALIALSTLWSPDASYGLERTFKIATSIAAGIFLFFTAVELPEEHRMRLRRLFIGSFICFGLLLLAVNMLTHASLYRLVTSNNALDASGEGGNRAAVVISVLLWPCMLATWETGRRKLALILPFVALGVSMLTDSQTAQVSIVAGLLMYGISKVAPRTSLVLATAAGVVTILVMPFFFRVSCPSLLQPGIGWHAASVGARLEIWCTISAAVFQAPIIGHGVEATRFVQDWGMAHLYFPDKSVLHPHNAALQIWYEFGLLGALLATGIWIAMIKRVACLLSEARSVCLASLMSILMISCISHGLWQSWWLGTVGVVPALFRMAGAGIWSFTPKTRGVA